MRRQKKPNAGDILREMAKTYDQRNAVYGENFNAVGDALVGFFPRGKLIASRNDFMKFHLFDWTVGKLSRFAATDLTHYDSIYDAGVYCALVAAMVKREEEDAE